MNASPPGAAGRRHAIAAVMCVLLLASCTASEPPALDPGSVRWVRFDNPVVGYSLSYPDVYAPSANGDGSYVIFRQGRFSPLIIRFVDEATGRKTGLWFASAPQGAVELGGIPGSRYVYTHYDGPFGARMIATVIPCRDRFLGVEIRTHGELDEVQKQILGSFTLTK
jgi:hypothetical protein